MEAICNSDLRMPAALVGCYHQSKPKNGGDMEWQLIWWGIGIGLIVVVFFAVRELLMLIRSWLLRFWMITDRVELLEEIRDQLQRLNAAGQSPSSIDSAVADKNSRIEPR